MGGLAGVGRRRDPGIEARVRALGQRSEAEGRAQAVGGAVADDDGQDEHAEQQQRTQGERIEAVGARRGPADPQLPSSAARRARCTRHRAAVRASLGTERQRILVGGGRAMPDARNALDAADGLLAGRPAHLRQPTRATRKAKPNRARTILCGNSGSAATGRPARADEQSGQTQHQPDARPKLLELQGPGAQPHLALKGPLDGEADPRACRGCCRAASETTLACGGRRAQHINGFICQQVAGRNGAAAGRACAHVHRLALGSRTTDQVVAVARPRKQMPTTGALDQRLFGPGGARIRGRRRNAVLDGTRCLASPHTRLPGKQERWLHVARQE